MDEMKKSEVEKVWKKALPAKKTKKGGK